MYGAHAPCILYLIFQLFRPALKQIAVPNHKERPYAYKPCRKFSATPLLESGVRKNGKKPTRCQKRHKASVTSVIQAVAHNLSSASGLMSFRRKETQIGRRAWLKHLPARTQSRWFFKSPAPMPLRRTNDFPASRHCCLFVSVAGGKRSFVLVNRSIYAIV